MLETDELVEKMARAIAVHEHGDDEKIINYLDYANKRPKLKTAEAWRNYVMVAKAALQEIQPDLAKAVQDEREAIPQDIIDYISKAILLATNHGGWFDKEGFKAMGPLCEEGNRLWEKYRFDEAIRARSDAPQRTGTPCFDHDAYQPDCPDCWHGEAQ